MREVYEDCKQMKADIVKLLTAVRRMQSEVHASALLQVLLDEFGAIANVDPFYPQSITYQRRTHMRAPDDSRLWKCGWIDCFYGMGLAGRGKCPGEWWNEHCPKYENEATTLERWRKEDATKSKNVPAGN